MKLALVKHTVRRLLGRSVTQLVLVCYGFFVLMTVLEGASGNAKGGNFSAAAWFLTWALGTGILGSERSDGYLPLLLSRPLSRAQYVLSRWAGLVLCAVLVDLALHLLIALLCLYFKKDADLHLDFYFQRWVWFCYFVPLCAAWIMLLSAIFGGNGDLLYFAGISLAVAYAADRFRELWILQKAKDSLLWFWMPGKNTLEAWQAGDWGAVAYTALFFVILAGTWLALAAYVMQRRDISYVNR